ARAEEPSTKTADTLFGFGKFTEADAAYRALSLKDPKNVHAILRLGELALFSNRLSEAESRLQEVLARGPENKQAKKLLAEAFYRQDDFDRAAKLLGELKQDVRAAQLASFRGQHAYAHEMPAGGPVTLPFVVTDPLPIVRAKVNGGEEVNFVIDTGAPE